jgi:hypothetical protein
VKDKEKPQMTISKIEKIENVFFGIVAVVIFGLSLFSGLGFIMMFPNDWSLLYLLMGVSVLFSGILSFVGILKKWSNKYIFTLFALEFIVAEIFLFWLDYDELKIQNEALAILCIVGFFGVVISQIFKKFKISVILTIAVLLAISAYILANVVAPLLQSIDANSDYTFLSIYVAVILIPLIFGIFRKELCKSTSFGIAVGFLVGVIFTSIAIATFSPDSRKVAGEGPEFLFWMLTLAITLPSMILGAFGGLVGYSVKWLAEKIKTITSAKQKP